MLKHAVGSCSDCLPSKRWSRNPSGKPNEAGLSATSDSNILEMQKPASRPDLPRGGSNNVAAPRTDVQTNSTGNNFDAPDLDDAWDLAGDGGPVCDQVLYHLQERAIEHRVFPWCEERGLAITAYSPFGHGAFPGPDTAGGRLLQEIAAEHNATPRQVVLRFLVRQPLVFAIPKASTPEHANENAQAGDLRLSEEEIALIDQAFPLGPPPAELPTL